MGTTQQPGDRARERGVNNGHLRPLLAHIPRSAFAHVSPLIAPVLARRAGAISRRAPHELGASTQSPSCPASSYIDALEEP
jgi:hypothetical protein